MKKRRLLSIVISLCMVLALMPQMVFATDISGNHDEEVTVNSDDTISGGTFNGKVTNKGTINDGTFTEYVYNEGTINDGTFYERIFNCGTGQIRGGTFCDTVDNVDGSSMIYDGTFKGTVNNHIGSIYGGTFKGTVNNYNGSIYGGMFYGGIDIAPPGTINGNKVTFKKDDNSTYAVEVVENGNKAIEPTIKPDAPEGKKFAGWYTDETLITSYDFNSGVTKDITLYARFDPIISITVPFTTKVELGGNVQPDETVFNMQVLDSRGGKYSSGNVKIEAKPVTTNGAGSYNGEITFTGTEAEIFNMFRHNRFVFVKQEAADYTNWKIDDTVWCLFHSGIAELSEGEVEPSPIIILPAISEYDGDVMYYDPVFPEDDEIQPYKMTFTNIYTKSEAGMVDPEGTTGGDSDNGNGSKSDKDSVKTGDNTNIALWLALMLLSGAGITGTAVYTRRKRTNE